MSDRETYKNVVRILQDFWEIRFTSFPWSNVIGFIEEILNMIYQYSGTFEIIRGVFFNNANIAFVPCLALTLL